MMCRHENIQIQLDLKENKQVFLCVVPLPIPADIWISLRKLTRDYCLCFQGDIAGGQPDDCRRCGFNNCGSKRETWIGQSLLGIQHDDLHFDYNGTQFLSRSLFTNLTPEKEFTRHARAAGGGGSLLDSSRRLWGLLNRDNHISATAKQKERSQEGKKWSHVSPGVLSLKGKEQR